jgi:hypothetical protein
LIFIINKNHGPKFAVTGLALRSIQGDALHHIASPAGIPQRTLTALSILEDVHQSEAHVLDVVQAGRERCRKKLKVQTQG